MTNTLAYYIFALKFSHIFESKNVTYRSSLLQSQAPNFAHKYKTRPDVEWIDKHASLLHFCIKALWQGRVSKAQNLIGVLEQLNDHKLDIWRGLKRRDGSVTG